MLVLGISLLLLYNVGSSRLRPLEVQFLTYITLIKGAYFKKPVFKSRFPGADAPVKQEGCLTPFYAYLLARDRWGTVLVLCSRRL